MTPTKCSTSVPSCASTKSDGESTPTTLEHAFPATMNPSTPSNESAAAAPPMSLTATKENGADIGKAVDKSEKAIQDLCSKIDRILEAFRDIKVDLPVSKDSTRDVAALSANIGQTSITLKVGAEAGSTNHVDSAKLGMGTTIKCSMKCKNQLVDDDGEDMANDGRTELTEVDTKFTPVNLCFRDPWLALNAIPSRNLIWCLSCDLGVVSPSFVPSKLEVLYHCFVLGSVCRASSPPVPPWRVAVPWYNDQVFSGSGSVVVVQPLQPWPPTSRTNCKGDQMELQSQPWPDPRQVTRLSSSEQKKHGEKLKIQIIVTVCSVPKVAIKGLQLLGERMLQEEQLKCEFVKSSWYNFSNHLIGDIMDAALPMQSLGQLVPSYSLAQSENENLLIQQAMNWFQFKFSANHFLSKPFQWRQDMVDDQQQIDGVNKMLLYYHQISTIFCIVSEDVVYDVAWTPVMPSNWEDVAIICFCPGAFPGSWDCAIDSEACVCQDC
uniref:Uncharacterized protein n=1 Tax=Oryza rufipogon TaxID=4529 RepID=A0A0E0Q6P7_ORYRU